MLVSQDCKSCISWEWQLIRTVKRKPGLTSKRGQINEKWKSSVYPVLVVVQNRIWCRQSQSWTDHDSWTSWTWRCWPCSSRCGNDAADHVHQSGQRELLSVDMALFMSSVPRYLPLPQVPVCYLFKLAVNCVWSADSCVGMPLCMCDCVRVCA